MSDECETALIFTLWGEKGTYSVDTFKNAASRPSNVIYNNILYTLFTFGKYFLTFNEN